MKQQLNWTTQRGTAKAHDLSLTQEGGGSLSAARQVQKKKLTGRLARDESQHILAHDLLHMTTDYAKVDENINRLLKMSESKVHMQEDSTS